MQFAFPHAVKLIDKIPDKTAFILALVLGILIAADWLLMIISGLINGKFPDYWAIKIPLIFIGFSSFGRRISVDKRAAGAAQKPGTAFAVPGLSYKGGNCFSALFQEACSPLSSSAVSYSVMSV